MKWYEWLVGGIIILAVLALMLVGIYDVNLRYQLVRVQTAPTMVAPLPALVVTPGSEVAALQQVVETQQAQINDLNRDLAKAKEDQQRDSIDIRWSLDSKLLMAGALASLAGLLGIGAYANIGEKVRERVRAMLDETILGYDPAWVPVYLPRGQKLLHDRLDYAGLKSIRLYANNALAPRPGITVVTVLDKDDEDQLAEFLQAPRAATTSRTRSQTAPALSAQARSTTP